MRRLSNTTNGALGFCKAILIVLLFPGLAISQIVSPKIDSLKSELSGASSDSARVALLLELSIEYQFIDFQQARNLVDEAAQLAESNDMLWGKMEASRRRSYLATIRGDFLSSLTYDKARLPIAVASNDSVLIASTLNYLGDDYMALGEYDEAYDYFTRSYKISKAIDDSVQAAIAMHNVGRVFKELGQYDIALDHLEISRKLSEQAGDLEGPAYTFNEVGDVYLRKQEYDLAEKTLMQALWLTRDLHINILEPEVISRLARLYLAQKEFEKSYNYYDTLETLHQKTQNEFGLAEAQLGKGKLLFSQNNYIDAANLVLEALSIAKRIDARTLQIDCLRTLSSLYEVQGDYKNALTYNKQSKILQDSLFSQDMMQKIFQDQVQLQTESKDIMIAELSETQARQANELKRQSFLKNIMVVVVALTVILLFTVYRSGQRRIRINKLLLEHQNEMKKRSLELEQLNQVKDKFFSVISHDLRSPINSLSAILDLMAKNQIRPEELPHLTQELQLQFNHTKTLINNLLDWTLLQMDKLRIQPTKIHLKDVVDDNFKLLSSLHIKAIKLTNLVPNDVYAHADLNMISLVLRNLILNGIKFTEAGGEIKVNAERQGEELIVSVQDNGVGISPEVQKILFEKTTGYSTRGTANEKGTGLGLILCKEFVERNGGKIWLNSEEGKGSTFFFTVARFV